MKRLLFVAVLCGSLMLTGCVPWWNHGHGGGGYDHGGDHGHDDGGGQGGHGGHHDGGH